MSHSSSTTLELSTLLLQHEHSRAYRRPQLIQVRSAKGVSRPIRVMQRSSSSLASHAAAGRVHPAFHTCSERARRIVRMLTKTHSDAKKASAVSELAVFIRRGKVMVSREREPNLDARRALLSRREGASEPALPHSFLSSPSAILQDSAPLSLRRSHRISCNARLLCTLSALQRMDGSTNAQGAARAAAQR